MSRKTKKIILALLLLILAARIIQSFLYTGQNCCGIPGNRVDVHAPSSMVLLRCGLPDQRSLVRSTHILCYTYKNAELFGRKAEISYYISKFRVYWIQVTFRDQEDVQGLYQTAVESIGEYYQKLKGYRVLETDDGVVLGTDGPPEVNADLSVNGSTLLIDVTYQK